MVTSQLVLIGIINKNKINKSASENTFSEKRDVSFNAGVKADSRSKSLLEIIKGDLTNQDRKN